MIPTAVEEEVIVNDFELVSELPTKTYYLDVDKNRVIGLTDGQQAMRQVAYKTLQTERYRYNKIYSDNYGFEFEALIGQPMALVIPELERRIREALLWDERFTNVYNFNFDINMREVHVTCRADTIYGEIDLELQYDV